MKKKTMRMSKGISMISLVITIVLILILAAIGFASSRSSIKSANKSAYMQELSDIQELVSSQRISNQIYGADEENKGFYKKRIANPPASFVSFDENMITGYVVDLETINFEDATRGIEYGAFQSEEKTTVTFGRDDVYVYDAEGTAYYAKGIRIEDSLFYTLEELSANGPKIISKNVIPAADLKSAEIKIVLRPVGDGEVTVKVEDEFATLVSEDEKEKTFSINVYENKTYRIVAEEKDMGSTAASVDVTELDVPTYQIIYNANGGINEPPQDTKTENIPLKLSLAYPERDGYTFLGWSTKPDGTLAEYRPGSQFTTDEDTTLYAVWVKGDKTYNVIYSANGGTGAPAADFAATDTYTISFQIPRREGFGFDGWSTDPKATSGQYVGGDTISLDSNIELYAIWVSSTHTVAITVEPETAGTVVGTGAKATGSHVVIAATPIDGYIFSGWKVVSGGAKIGSTVSSTTTFTMPNDDVILQAKFSEIKMTLKYDANGGSRAPASVTAKSNSTIQLSIDKPVRTGHTFLGWSLRKDETVATYEPGGDYILKENVTLYAVWEENVDFYTLSYEIDGEEQTTGEFAPRIKTKGETIQIPYTKPTKEGFTFLGWGLERTSRNVIYKAGEIYEKDATTILYSIFKDESAPTINVRVEYEDDKIILIADVHDEGFIGGYKWTTTNEEPEDWETDGTGEKDLTTRNESVSIGENYFFVKDAAGNVAMQELTIYQIKYDANGGSGAPESQLKAKGIPIELSSVVPTKNEYQFLGWSASANPGNTMASVTYASGDTYESDADITLKAVWGAVGFELSTPVVELQVGGSATDVIITRGEYTGELTVVSSNENYAKAEIIDDILRIYPGEKAGEATITVTESSSGTTRKVLAIVSKGVRNVTITTSSFGFVYGADDGTATLSYQGNQTTTTVISSNENTATGTVSGYTLTIKPKNVGSAKLTVTVGADESYSEKSIDVQVVVTKKDLVITPASNQQKEYDGTTSTPELAYTWTGQENGETPKFTGSLSRVEGSTVGKYQITLGTLTMVENGTFLPTNYQLKLSTTAVNFEITHKYITKPTLNTPQTYDGTTKYAYVEGDGYERSDTYEATNAGTYSATLSLTDTANTLWADTKNTAARSETWVIKPATISEAIANGKYVIKTISDRTYTGSAIEPKPEITGFGKILTENTDYTLGYTNNLNVGTATITITGKGNYTGTATTTFNIVASAMEYDAIGYTGTYDGEAHAPTINVTKPAVGATIYFAEVALDSDNCTTKGSTTKPTYKNAGTTTVYFLIRADNYTDHTGSMQVKITPKSIESGMEIAGIVDKQYTGSNITQSVTVKDNALGVMLTSGTDFNVAYSNNKDVSTSSSKATVTITGDGNYTGTVTKTFNITGDNITITPSTNALTTSITIEITKEIPATTLQYSFDNSSWTPYTGKITITKDCTIYARSIDENNSNKVIGSAYLEIANICEHSKVAATCTEDGYCSLCGFIMEEALGHDYSVEDASATYLNTAATCTANAIYNKKCSRCDAFSTEHTFEKADSALGHDFNKLSGIEATPATCTAAQTCYYSCTRCNVQGTETYTNGNPLGHDLTKQSTTLRSEATCTDAATYYLQCSRCDEIADTSKYYTKGDPLGHDFTVQTTTSTYQKSVATCIAPAEYYYQCSRCTASSLNNDNTTYTVGDVDSSNHVGGVTAHETEATETTAGRKWTTCNSCGAELTSENTYVESAKAIFSATDGSLRFYKNYDLVEEGSTYNGREATSVYYGIERDTYTTTPWFEHSGDILTVVVEEEIKPISTTNWFENLRKLSTGDLTKLNTSRVTNMWQMFTYAGYDATTFELNLSSWDTSSVTNMGEMFCYAGYNATTWDIGNLSNWDTSSVTSMAGMFAYAGRNATTLDIRDLSNWDTSKVEYMQMMFSYTGYNATTFNLNLSGWNTARVTYMQQMFSYAGYNATTWNIGDLSKWNTSSVTSMSSMFAYAGKNATTWDIGDLSTWNTSKVTTMKQMFRESGYNATTWDIGDLSTKMVTKADGSQYTAWDTSSVTSMEQMFYCAGYKASILELDLSNWNASKVTSMKYMFYAFGNNSTIFKLDLSNWDTSGVTTMSEMFYYAGYSATSFKLDLTDFDTSSVTDMKQMFRESGYKATTWSVEGLSGWDTSNVTNMWYMFLYAGGYNSSAITLDLSNWDTSSVTDSSSTTFDGMNGMFSMCRLHTITLGPNFSTTGDGTCTDFTLPTPDTSYFANADGYWYDQATGTMYLPSAIPSNTAATYSIEAPKTAFAIYSEEDNSLRFYKNSDLNNIAINGEYNGLTVTSIYTGFEETAYSDATTLPWYSIRTNITEVVIEEEISPVTLNFYFWEFSNVAAFNVTNLNTSLVKGMHSTFYHAGENVTTFKIEGLDGWDTSNVTTMSQMFWSAGENATTWSIGDLSKWNTSKVADMRCMFSDAGTACSTWSIGDLSNWNTASVLDMGNMFSAAGKKSTTFNIGNIGNWDTSSVTSMRYMFHYAGNKSTTFYIGDLSNWDVSKVTSMPYMFGFAGESCKNWNIGDLSTKTVTKSNGITYTAWNTGSVTNMYGMLSHAGYNNTTFDIGDIGTWDTSNVTNMSFMLNSIGYKATTFNIGDLSNWDVSKVTNMQSAFVCAGYSATTFNIGDLSNWNTSSVTTMQAMFSNTGYSATTFDLGNLNTKTVTKTDGTTYTAWDTSKVTSMYGVFYYAGYSATTWNIGNLSNWNTQKVSTMSNMFSYAGYNSTNLVLDLSNWDTSNVTKMTGMFSSMRRLHTITLGSNFSTTGDGTCTFSLPTIDTTYFTNSDGLWYDVATGIGYAPDAIPTNTAATYSVEAPEKVTAIYSSTDNSLRLYKNSEASNATVNGTYNNLTVTNKYSFYETAAFGYKGTPWYEIKDNIKNVVVEDEIKPTSTTYLFSELLNATSIDVTNLDVANVTNMQYTFYQAGKDSSGLTITGMGAWDTSKVTSMKYMFYEAGNYGFDAGNLSGWNTSKVTNMEGLFDRTANKGTNTTWNVGDLSNWDTSKVSNMQYIFCGAGKTATSFDIGNIGNWNTENVTTMKSAFYEAGMSSSTWSIGDISNWNTSKVTDMYYMFGYAGTSGDTFDLGNLNTKIVTKADGTTYTAWDITNVSSIANMFAYAGQSATTWNIGQISNWNLQNITDISNLFFEAGANVATWNLGDLSTKTATRADGTTYTAWDVSKIENMRAMFYKAGSEASTWNIGDISNWDTSSVTSLYHSFSHIGLNVPTFNIGDLSSWKVSKVATTQGTFFNAGYNSNTFSLGNLDNWDIQNVENTSYMFCQTGRFATSWNIGKLTNWKTGKITEMQYMFSMAGNSGDVVDLGNLNDWDTSNVTDMNHLFTQLGYDATTFNIGNLSEWDTSKVTNMQYMFYKTADSAPTFDIGDISGWNTSNVTDMQYMFTEAGQYATTFNVGDFSGWNTDKVTNMTHMFHMMGRASSGITLDLSNWNTANVTDMTSMFAGMSRLHTITLGSKFDFLGNGSTSCTLPDIDRTYFTTSDGNWYDTTMYVGYAPDAIPNKTAATYTVEAPSGTKITIKHYLQKVGAGTEQNDTNFDLEFTEVKYSSTGNIDTSAYYREYNGYSTYNTSLSQISDGFALSYYYLRDSQSFVCNACADCLYGKTCTICIEECEHTSLLNVCRAHCPSEIAHTGETSDICECCGLELVDGYCQICRFYEKCENHTPKCLFHCEWLHCACDGCTELITYTPKEENDGEYSVDGIVTENGNFCYTCDPLCTEHSASASQTYEVTLSIPRYSNMNESYADSGIYAVEGKTYSITYDVSIDYTSATAQQLLTNGCVYVMVEGYTDNYVATLAFTPDVVQDSAGTATGSGTVEFTAPASGNICLFGSYFGTGGTALLEITSMASSSEGPNYCTVHCPETHTKSYTVKHWQQNIDADTTQNSTNYTVVDTVTGTGTIGSSVTPTVNSYTGFTSPSAQTVMITADENTINYYYTRNSYTLTLDKNSYVSSVSGGGTYHYGKSVTINLTLGSATGYTYTFSNWTSSNTSLVLDQTVATATITIPAGNVTLTANGARTANTYTVTLNKGTGISSVTGAGTYTYGDTVTINATVSSGYTWSKWSGTHSTTTKQYTFTMPASNVTDTANAVVSAVSLASKVSVGDYVDYPVSYSNVWTYESGYTPSLTGWRVVKVSGGQVYLVSAGVPLRYAPNNSDASTVASNLSSTSTFKTLSFAASGFSSTLSSVFSNDYTYGVRSLTKADVDSASGSATTYTSNLFALPAGSGCAYYWLATLYTESSGLEISNAMFMIANRTSTTSSSLSFNTTGSDSPGGGAHGIRPVVILKSTVNVTGGSGTSSSPWEISVN